MVFSKIKNIITERRGCMRSLYREPLRGCRVAAVNPGNLRGGAPRPKGVRTFLIGLPLAAVCLTGFTAACSSPHPVLAGPASAGPASAGPASAESAPAGLAPAGLASAEGILTGHLYAV